MEKMRRTKGEDQAMTGAEMVMTALAEHGVQHIFGYPGGMALPLYDALRSQSSIHHILVAHEQGAAHAAEGYAISTGKPGCVLVTSGPGATNIVTGLMDAFADSVPLIAITGQVKQQLVGTDAFQECDITGITLPCTKHNYLVKDIKDLPEVLHEAFHIATSGRPGPVLIDIPVNVQEAKGVYRAAAEVAFRPNREDEKAGYHRFSQEAIERAIDMMLSAERPIFYTGGGVIASGEEASDFLRELVAETGFPITSTLKGLGAYPASGTQWLGMLGAYGVHAANKAMHGADLIVAIGARFDDRVTGNIDEFAPNAKIIHIDIDPSSINKIVHADLGIAVDCKMALPEMLAAWRAKKQSRETSSLTPWWDRIQEWKQEPISRNAESLINPEEVLAQLNAMLPGKDVYIVTDVGQHQMWTAQHIGIEQPGHLITSGGMGTMGFGLPAAIGVQTAHPDSLVICITGDGSFQMNSQEMITARRQGLPVKVLILNNSALGMVRQLQEHVYDKRYVATVDEVQPHFVTLASAYGWAGLKCFTPGDVGDALTAMMTAQGPCLLDCHIDPLANCYPMIPAGAGHDRMIMAPVP